MSFCVHLSTFPVSSQDPATLKEEGNVLFKAGDLSGAVCCYTKALNLSGSQSESAVLYRNRSACYLKLEEYSEAAADATKGGDAHTPAHYRVNRLLVTTLSFAMILYVAYDYNAH